MPPDSSVKLKDALAYLEQIKGKFEGKPQIYNQFLDVMKQFEKRSIDTPGVIKHILKLFKGDRQLILGFNTFLPPGVEIYFPHGSSMPSVKKPGGAEDDEVAVTGQRSCLEVAIEKMDRARREGRVIDLDGEEDSATLPAAAASSSSTAPPTPAAHGRLLAGSRAEVAGCDDDHAGEWDGVWEECTVVADHGATCDVRIVTDGQLCEGVPRRFVPLAFTAAPCSPRASRKRPASNSASSSRQRLRPEPSFEDETAVALLARALRLRCKKETLTHLRADLGLPADSDDAAIAAELWEARA